MIVVGDWPGRLRVGLNGHFGVLPALIASAGGEDSPLLNDVDPGDESTEFAWVIRSLPGSGVLTADDFGGVELVGAADGVYVIPYGLYTAAPGAGAVWDGDTDFTVTVGDATALVLAGGVLTRKTPAPTDRRLYLNAGDLQARTAAASGDRLITVDAAGAWQAGLPA